MPAPAHRPPRNRPGRPRAAWGAAAAALPLLAAGCSPGGHGDATPDGDTFVYLSHTEVITEWDPARAYSNELMALPNLYETLTRYNAETEEVEPLLATDWESSDDGLTWTFTLREDVVFHSGRPMDAASVKAAVERTIELDAGAAYVWDAVEEVTAPEEHTVRFELSYPAPLDLVGAASYAAYVYEVPDDADDFEASSRGTGPYTVESWNPGSENELDLAAHEDYWGGWEGDHYTRVSFRVVPQASTMAQLMSAGEAHYARGLPPQLLDTLREDPGVTVVESPSWQNLFGLMNTEKAPLDDVRVRRAIAHAVDYGELITATGGAFVASDGVIPEGIIGHSTDTGLPATDPERARELLEEAGYGPEGDQTLELDLTYTEGDDSVRTMAELMKAQLSPLGVELNIEALPWDAAQWPRAQADDPQERQDILLMYWWPDDPQPLSWFHNMFRTEEEILFNLGYYSNPEFDELVDGVGALTATDREAAERTYRRMQEILIEDAPALYLGTQVYQRVLSTSVEGFSDNPMYANVVFVHDCAPR